MKTNKRFLVFIAFLSTTFLIKESMANTLKIINKDNKKIEVSIVPIAGPTEKSSKNKTVEIEKEAEITFDLKAEEIANKDKFYVTRDTTIRPGGTCDNLDFKKNYEIIFDPKLLTGTDCISKEIDQTKTPNPERAE